MGNLVVTIKCAGPGCIRGPVDIEPPPLWAKLKCVVCGHITIYTGGHVRISIEANPYASKFADTRLDDCTVDDLYPAKITRSVDHV